MISYTTSVIAKYRYDDALLMSTRFLRINVPDLFKFPIDFYATPIARTSFTVNSDGCGLPLVAALT